MVMMVEGVGNNIYS